MERIFIVSFFFFALCLFISSKDTFGAPVEQEVTLEDGTVLKVLINDPQTPPPHIISAKKDNKNDSSNKDDDKSSQNQDIIIHELKYPPPPKLESLTHSDERSDDSSSSNNSVNTQDIIVHEAVWAPPPVMSENQYGNSVDHMGNHRLRRDAGTGGNAEEPVIRVQEIHPPSPRMESRRRRRNAEKGGNTEEPRNVIVVEEIRPPPPLMDSSRLKRDDQPDDNVNLANNVSGNYEITTEGSHFTDSQGIAGDNESTLEEHRESNRVSEDRDVTTSAINESTGIQSDLQSAANVSSTPDSRSSTAAEIHLNESSAVKNNESSEIHQTYTGNANISEGNSILDRKNNDTNVISVVDSNNPDVPGGRINYTIDKPVDSAGDAGINPEIDRKDVDTAGADANKGPEIPDDANKAINNQSDSAGDAGINPEIGKKAGADANKGLEIPDDANKAINNQGDSAGDNSISPEIGSKDVDDADADDLQIPDNANNEVNKAHDFDEDSRINLDSADKKPSDDDKYAAADTGDKDNNAFDLGNNNDDDDENEYDADGGGFDDKEQSDRSKQAEKTDDAENFDEDNAGETNSGKPYSKGELLGSGRSELQRKLVAEESQSTHFMSYFLVAVVFVACFYLVFHNRQKIKAYVLEGRSGLRGRRRKVAGGEYRQLSSTEDVLPASDKTKDPKTDYAY